MHVLVAGGAGFIGSHLCESLLLDGYSVTCLDNLTTGDKRNIEELTKKESFDFIKADVSVAFSQVVSPDFVFHLASPASPNKNNPKSYIKRPIETLLAN